MYFRSSLFDIPIYKSKMINHFKVKEYIHNCVLPIFLKNGPNDIDRHLFSSYFDGAPQIDKELFDGFYKKDIDSFMNKAGFNNLRKWDVHCKYWYNLSYENAYQEQHDHLHSPRTVTYVAVHYIDYIHNVHPPTVYFNPLLGYLKNMNPSATQHFVPNDFKDIQKTFNVEEGDIVFVPAYLPHRVPPQKTDLLRSTVAINVSIQEELNV